MISQVCRAMEGQRTAANRPSAMAIDSWVSTLADSSTASLWPKYYPSRVAAPLPRREAINLRRSNGPAVARRPREPVAESARKSNLPPRATRRPPSGPIERSGAVKQQKGKRGNPCWIPERKRVLVLAPAESEPTSMIARKAGMRGPPSAGSALSRYAMGNRPSNAAASPRSSRKYAPIRSMRPGAWIPRYGDRG